MIHFGYPYKKDPYVVPSTLGAFSFYLLFDKFTDIYHDRLYQAKEYDH